MLLLCFLWWKRASPFDSHLPLWKWFLALYLMTESKKGISANQLKRSLNISYKTAWYLCHRIRKAMVEAGKKSQLDGIVEVDETYVGGKYDKRRKRDRYEKQAVVGLLQRDEFEWRFNGRENPYLFRDTLFRLLNSPKLEFKELTKKVS